MPDSPRIPKIPQRCDNCGSLVTLEANGLREDTTLSFRCPGCGSLGTSCYGEYPLEQAHRLAEQQNVLAATSEAAVDAQRWKERVAQWIAADAAIFLYLLQDRFPGWSNHLHYEPDPYLDGSHRLTIPSANPQVETPLSLTVTSNEVLISWVWSWHLHVFRCRDAGQDDKTHLIRALKEVENLVEERTVTGTHFRNGEPCGGGNLPPGEGVPDKWKEAVLRFSHSEPVSIAARSWRGTYDAEWHPEQEPL